MLNWIRQFLKRMSEERRVLAKRRKCAEMMNAALKDLTNHAEGRMAHQAWPKEKRG